METKYKVTLGELRIVVVKDINYETAKKLALDLNRAVAFNPGLTDDKLFNTYFEVHNV